MEVMVLSRMQHLHGHAALLGAMASEAITLWAAVGSVHAWYCVSPHGRTGGLL